MPRGTAARGKSVLRIGALDIAVLVAYLAAVGGIGAYAGRRNKSTDDYFVGGRSMPGWVVGISILGTCISSVTYVAYPGKALVSDWQYLVQGLMLPAVFVCGGFLAAGFYRRRTRVSVNELLEARFGAGARLFSLFFLIMSEVARVASVLYLFSLVVHAITGAGKVETIIVVGLATTAYAVVGGIKGVIWTDVIQTVALIAGGVLTVAVVSAGLPGGFGELVSTALDHDKLRVFDFTPDLARDAFFVLALSGLVNFFYFLAGNQNQVQRYQCASSDREALKATAIGALGSVPVWALFMLVGTALFAHYNARPDPEVAALLAGGRGDEVFPRFIAEGLPAGLSGLLVAGLFGAAMSSLDSSMNAASTLAVTDLYRRHINPGASDGRALGVARTLTLFWGALGIFLALAMIRIEVFLNFYFKIVSLAIGAITGLFFLALVSRRAHRRGVLAGLASSAPLMVWGFLDIVGLFKDGRAAYAFPLHDIMVGVLSAFWVAIAGYLASLALRDPGGRELL